LCLASLKQRDAANQAFQAALKDDPNARPVRFDYARFLAEGGNEVEALKWLHQLMAEDSSETRVWQFGGLVALSKPEFLEFALDWTGEAIKLHPAHPAIAEQRATALLLGGKADEARGIWQQLNPSANPIHRAAVILCEALLNQPSPPVPGELAGRVNQEFVSWYRRLLAFNASAIVHTLNQRIDLLRRAVPAAARVLEMALADVNTVPVK
jgi:tetratricopeptide (TPR) repeat protein